MLKVHARHDRGYADGWRKMDRVGARRLHKHVLLALSAAIFALLVAIGAGPALAQKGGGGSSFNDVQIIVNPRLAVERAYRLRTGIQRNAGHRLANTEENANSGQSTQSTPMLFAGSEEGERSGGADMWNVWADATCTRIEDRKPGAGYEGPQNLILVGGDYRLSDRVIAGLVYNYNDSDTDNLFQPGNSTTESNGIGPYVGVVLTDHLVFDASYLGTWTDNFGFDGTDTARYDSDGWIATSNLTGYWYRDKLRISPAVGISYTRTEDDAYIDTSGAAFPSQTTKTGTFTTGLTLGYTTDLSTSRSLEAFVGIEGEWEFENSTSPPSSTASVPPAMPGWDARFSAGLELTLPGDKIVSIKGDIGGLARNRYQSYGVVGNIAIPF